MNENELVARLDRIDEQLTALNRERMSNGYNEIAVHIDRQH